MAEFNNIYAHGFVRTAAASPRVHLADPASNARETIELMRKADKAGAALIVFPELGLSGYTIDDLHLQSTLLASVLEAIAKVKDASRSLAPVVVVGAPIQVGSGVHGCAVVIHRGAILGVVPKTYLPNYREFYEKRQFAMSTDAVVDQIVLAGETVPFGADLSFEASDVDGFTLAVEICEDMWAPVPPSTFAALAGANIIANLSASNITIGKAAERDMLCISQSARTACGYIYSAAGYGESTTDTAWDGQLAVYELGSKIAESDRFADQSALLVADIDVARIAQDRIRNGTFRDTARNHKANLKRRRISFTAAPDRTAKLQLTRKIDRFPFVPDDEALLDQDCFEAYNIQVQGLRRRLEASGIKKAVIGISGGLDSTQALLVTVRAFDLMGAKRANIIGVTMPGFATTEGTKSKAHALMKELGIDAREVDIKPMANQMLADLEHPYAKGKKIYDITFENVQAGLRTDYLFRLANKEGGMVVGTGDLSELALGWCTYGVGDHMSHYNVNSAVAKTLIQHLIRWSAASGLYSPSASDVMRAILDQEISPELVPAGADGKIQSTEDTIGPYNLHDFFLNQTIRWGASPSRIAFLAHAAWGDAKTGQWPAHTAGKDRVAYDMPTIVKWLEVFAKRFFQTSQFKRSAVPNGPKVTSGGALSPRGDWRMPSDSSPAPWLEDIAKLKTQLGLKG
ncbi:MAG TPA: NAD(+) synthase [Hyphomonadaceae bacterium]|nr:NAD(+) synthase [Hyphomonadaceae bacterium]HPN06704.1 NAD(+) synthase [Hyphomonadaceae bacterium]